MRKQQIEAYLNGLIPEKGLLYDAMRYSLLGGGKRLRPQLAMMAAEALGGTETDALCYGAALECIHTYSLIHDDLPCMDDDDLRRGRPTLHKQFDEATAVLAGDGLLTLAFSIAARAPLSSDRNLAAVTVLSDAAGAYGMVQGQMLDMTLSAESPTEDILEMYRFKTGALLRAAVALGCIAAGGKGDELEAFSQNLGVAFQLQDDILDVVGDEKVLGKPIQSDSKNDKHTVISVIGIEKAREWVHKYTDLAIESIAFLGEKGTALSALAKGLVEREM
ncbi:MAG: polyprenyl synthetase family protein [Ruminococcaceae bacterium]|nr:polyprenyl synthetase family protein [Oscillospiraceae bacterium]